MTIERVARRGWINALLSQKSLTINLLRARTAILQVNKTEAQTANGSISVGSSIMPDYPYSRLIRQNYDGEALVANEPPFYFFNFETPDAGTSAHETMTGAPMTVALGAGAGVIPATEGLYPVQGAHGMLDPRSSVSFTSAAPMAVQDNSGNPWTVSFWMYWTGGSVNSIYLEAVPALTQQIGVNITAAGLLYVVNGAGTTRWTSTVAATANVWQHHAVKYDGANIRHDINGVLVSGPTAYAHGSTFPTVSYLNFNALNQLFLSSCAVWKRSIGIGESLAQYLSLASPYGGGFNATTAATMVQNSIATILFTNNAQPGLVSGTFNIIAPLLPTALVNFFNGFFQYELVIVYED